MKDIGKQVSLMDMVNYLTKFLYIYRYLILVILIEFNYQMNKDIGRFMREI